jgi:DNA-directed RNA polymerase specialized sigma24 family protein
MTAPLETAANALSAVAPVSRVRPRRWKARTAESHSALVTQRRAAAPADPSLWLYRDRTTALLRRYLRLSLQVGRLPSLLGRDVFRAHVTSYRAATFEDAVIFVHDIERCLERLPPFDKSLVALIALQEHTQLEAAQILGCGLRTVLRNYPEVLDRVSEMFLGCGILLPLPGGN